MPEKAQTTRRNAVLAQLEQEPTRTVKLGQNPYPRGAWPDVELQLNGQKFIIPRGKEVEVPESVYLALKDAGEV